MCGFTGWAFGPPDRAALTRSLARLDRRGPDDEGTWSSPRATLGHRRLAVIDRGARGRQPLASEDGTVQVVFNGEIYNYRELRDLLRADHAFVSDTDSEVLVHGYEEWGIDGLLQRISGMFAFAIWDDRASVLHLARDRVGKKPLYYARRGRTLVFASTLPAVLEMLPGTPAVRPDAVADYLQYQCVPGDKTFVSGVHKLLPAHRATFDGAQLKLSRYWRLSFRDQDERDEDEWLSAIDAELRGATARRLTSDVPLGVFLSGGVDSSLVTALVSDATDRKVVTFSAGFEDARFDELPFARTVARHLGTEHHEVIIRADAARELPALVHAAGEPTADLAVLPLMLISREAKKRATVMLTGDGGDEAFAGYPGPLLALLGSAYRRGVAPPLRRAAVPWLARAARLPGPHRPYARRLRRLAESSEGEFIWRFDMLGEKAFRRYPDILHPALAAAAGDYDADTYWDDVFSAADGPTDADRVLALELQTLLPDLFLAKADTASMAHGLELRSPLLDTRVLELSARIPAAAKMRRFTTKRLLKRLALRHVPREVVVRRKQGFSVPVGVWLRGDLAPTVRRLLGDDCLGRREIVQMARVRTLVEEHMAQRQDHGQRLWALMVVELWCQAFVDRQLGRHDVLDAGSSWRAPAPARAVDPPTLA